MSGPLLLLLLLMECQAGQWLWQCRKRVLPLITDTHVCCITTQQALNVCCNTTTAATTATSSSSSSSI
jgi:hypothetical protein